MRINIFVINLRKDTNKRNNMKEKLQKHNINFIFFEAVNGYKYPHIDKYNEYKKKPIGCIGSHINEKIYKSKMIRSPGAWGYIETWINLLNFSITMNYKRILVFDDDIVFDDNFDNKLQLFINQINVTTAKIILFGASQYEKYNIDFSNEKKYYLAPHHTDGSFASGIDGSIFAELLEHIKKRNCSVDSGAFREIYKKYPNNCYVAYPNLIIADTSESSICSGKNIFNEAEILKWNLDNFSDLWIYLKHIISVILVVNKKNINKFCSYFENLKSQTYKNIEIIIINNSNTLLPINNVKIYTNILDNPIKYGIQKSSGYYINICDFNYKYKNSRFSKEIKFLKFFFFQFHIPICYN